MISITEVDPHLQMSIALLGISTMHRKSSQDRKRVASRLSVGREEIKVEMPPFVGGVGCNSSNNDSRLSIPGWKHIYPNNVFCRRFSDVRGVSSTFDGLLDTVFPHATDLRQGQATEQGRASLAPTSCCSPQSLKVTSCGRTLLVAHNVSGHISQHRI